jgi:hypothetical protein
MRNSTIWYRRILSICPVLIGLLWVAGISHFRGYSLSPREWAVLVAAAFALHLLTLRFQRRRPAPTLPDGANPVTVSLFAAAILAVIAAIVAGAFEAIVDQYRPSEVALPWRATWHAACAFAATYCGFLQRLALGQRRQTRR